MDAKEKWNRKYENKISIAEEGVPNGRLLKLAPSFKGGKAIDIACGLGGNSLLLAELGFKVTAVDISDVAITCLSERAARRGLNVRSLIADITDGSSLPFQSNTFDLALMTYFLDRTLFPIVKNIVKKNGYFFMETFYKTPDGGRQSIPNKYKLESNELLEEFKDWKILFFEEDEQEGRQTIYCQKQTE